MPCLDMKNGRVVKRIHFVQIKDAGDRPRNPARRVGRYISKEQITRDHEVRMLVMIRSLEFISLQEIGSRQNQIAGV